MICWNIWIFSVRNVLSEKCITIHFFELLPRKFNNVYQIAHSIIHQSIRQIVYQIINKSFMQSCVELFIQSFIESCIESFFESLIESFIESFIKSFFELSIESFTVSFNKSFTSLAMKPVSESLNVPCIGSTLGILNHLNNYERPSVLIIVLRIVLLNVLWIVYQMTRENTKWIACSLVNWVISLIVH